jgi:nucleotide-binding universal stress UspA family protein
MARQDPSSSASTYAAIMVSVDGGPESDNRVKLAAGVADRFAARLIGVAALPVSAPLYFETPTDGVASFFELEERRVSDCLDKAERDFRRIVGANNGIEWRCGRVAANRFVAEQARAADLIVASRPRHGLPADAEVDAGDLVMNAGRAVLMAPPRTERLSAKHVIVGWKDTREARRAVRDSLPFLKQAEDVSVIAIGEPTQGGTDVCTYLRHHGIEARAYSRPGGIASMADELVRIAEQEGADLIVCGAYGHSRTREWVFGGVTRELLDHAPVCCLMAH